MSFFIPPSKIFLALALVSGLVWIYMEVLQLVRRRKARKHLIRAVFNRWLEICCDHIQYKEIHVHQNDEHPHRQWFIHREASVYERYLNLKGKRSQPEADYLAECKSKMRNGSFYKPED